MKRKLVTAILFLLFGVPLYSYGDTPAPGTVKIKGGTDGTSIGNVADALKVSGSFTPSGTTTVVQPTGTNLHTVVDSGSVTISNPSTNYALESGGHLSSIDLKLPSLGQALAAGSVPVVLTAAQLATLTPFASVGRTWNLVFASDKVDASGSSVTVSNPTTNFALESGGHLASIDTKLTSPLTTNATLQAGTANIGHVDGQGTAGSPSGGVVSVQGVSGGQALPVSGTITITPSGNQTVVQPTASNLNATVVTTGGAAISKDSSLTTINTTLGSPFQAGGSIGNTSFQATQATAANLNATVVQSSGANLHVNVDSAPTTAVTGTVTANAGTNLNTSALQLDTTGAKLNNAQGSTTSGQSGPLTQGAVTTASPSYTTAQTSPLSLTTAGALRTDASATTQPVSGTVTANAGTGTFTVSGTVTANAGTNLNTSALATSANQTTLGNQTTKINDGTNTMAVKAASTAPVATDPAAVVALSPNGNQAKDTSVTGLQVAQATTTSGQSGTLIQAAVTTSDPAYTNAQTDPLTQNVRGGLRTVVTGMDSAQTPIRNDYSANNVTTAAYFQLIASTSAEIHRIQVFDSSGQDFVLATGGAGSEVDQVQIPPGGWDAPVDLFIASGTRVSIKSKSATASSGILLLTVLK